MLVQDVVGALQLGFNYLALGNWLLLSLDCASSHYRDDAQVLRMLGRSILDHTMGFRVDGLLQKSPLLNGAFIRRFPLPITNISVFDENYCLYLRYRNSGQDNLQVKAPGGGWGFRAGGWRRFKLGWTLEYHHLRQRDVGRGADHRCMVPGAYPGGGLDCIPRHRSVGVHARDLGYVHALFVRQHFQNKLLNIGTSSSIHSKHTQLDMGSFSNQCSLSPVPYSYKSDLREVR